MRILYYIIPIFIALNFFMVSFTGILNFDSNNLSPVGNNETPVDFGTLGTSSSTGGFIESNAHGGSWLDSFKNSLGIENKSASIDIRDGSAVFDAKQATFQITSTTDFDAGTKLNTSTKTDESSIPAGEIQMTPIIVYFETFDGPDEKPLTEYNSDWYLSYPNVGTSKLDQNEQVGGNASLRLKTKTMTTTSMVMNSRLDQNYSGLEVYMKFVNNGVGTGQFSYVQTYKKTPLSIAVRFLGGSSGKIRSYDGNKMIETGSMSQNTWYKLTLDHNYETQSYNGWIDGGSYSNYQVANKYKFYQAMTDAWAEGLSLNSGTSWTGVNVTTWFDNLTLFGYPETASWESSTITLPPEMRINEINLEHYNLTNVSYIEKVQWLVNNTVKAEYDQSVKEGTSTIITETDLTSGSFMAVNDDFTIRIDFSSNQARTPAVKEIWGRFEHVEGTLISKSISLDSGSAWDTLVIDKKVPSPEKIQVSLLDSSNLPISGFIDITSNGEIDISNLNPLTYPTIKLKARFLGHIDPPMLNYWGVSWNAKNAWRDTFFVNDKATRTNLTAADGETWLTTDLYEWIKYSNNPIILNGSASSFDALGVKSPAVLRSGNDFKMWYVGINNATWEIGYATSSDGQSWSKYSSNPVLTTGGTGAWDENYIGSPTVLFDGSVYKMWYQGQNTQQEWQIGYATSTDGITWQKYSNNPVLSISSGFGWDSHFASLPNVYYDGSIYHMYYSGISKSSTSRHYQIGYATSIDGINWTKYFGNPIISGPSGWYLGVGNLFVRQEGSTYFGWYNNKIKSNEIEINLATSTDMVTWSNHSGNPALSKGSSGSWDSQMVLSPKVYFVDKQYYMYYTGSDGSRLLLGLAKSKFHSPGILRSELISVPSGFDLGTLIINKTEPAGTSILVSVINATDNQAVPGYSNLAGTEIDLSGINTDVFNNLMLIGIFESTGENTSELFDWSMNWVERKEKEGCVDIDPNTLNLKSKGNWITVYIEPQDGRDPANINVSTVIIYLPDDPNTTVSAALHPATVGDHDNDSKPDLMVKFKRSDVQALVSVGENVTLAVEGYYYDSLLFRCSDTIRVINPPDEPHNKGKVKS